MFLIDKLGISKSLANTIYAAIAAGEIVSWIGALIPGPGWIVDAILDTAEVIVENEGKAAAIAF